MSKVINVIIALAALTAAAECRAQSAYEGPVPWAIAPEIAYPAEAVAAGFEGAVTASCRIAEDGRLNSCVAPEDEHGLAAAAITGLNSAAINMEGMPPVGPNTTMRLRAHFTLSEGPAVRVAHLASVVTNPRWVVRPMPRYPAEGAGQVGEVRLRCTVLTSGRIGECDIVAETPPGFGFGREAVDAARRASLEARESEGTVHFPMRFRP